MQLTGDQTAIDQLKSLTKKSKDFFKFLIEEARTNSNASADFKGEDGHEYVLTLNSVKDTIEVKPKA